MAGPAGLFFAERSEYILKTKVTETARHRCAALFLFEKDTAKAVQSSGSDLGKSAGFCL